MIDVKILSKPKKSSEGSSGGSSSKTAYVNMVVSEAEHASRADKAKRADAADQADYANRAGTAVTANHATIADEIDIDSENLQHFLRKDKMPDNEDGTPHVEVVEGRAQFDEQVRFGASVEFDEQVRFEALVEFVEEIMAYAKAHLKDGATFGENGAAIDRLGQAALKSIRSLDYDNAAEQGFSIERETSGKYHAFVTNLTVWGKAIFHELEIRKLSYAGGNIYLSGAGSKLVKVVPVRWNATTSSWNVVATNDECEGWKCYLLADDGTTATMNYWEEGDQVRCQTMGEITSAGTYQDVSNKAYWRTIPDNGVSTKNEKIYGTKAETYLDDDGNEQTRDVQVELYDGQAFAWIVVGKHSEALDGYTEDNAPTETRDIPAEGDTVVLDGNRHRNSETLEYDKTDRQNVIVLETTGDYAPRIACYANITEYKHTVTKKVNGQNKEVSLSVFETSPKGGTKINSSRFEWISDDGSTINIINYRGDWLQGNTYHKNDQVNHNNAVWVCVANSGVDVTDEPSETSTYWRKVIEGVRGEDAVAYQVFLSTDNAGVLLNGQGKITITATIVKNGEDVTDTISAMNIEWLRISTDTEMDKAWNERHVEIGNKLTVTAEDVVRSATFVCNVYYTDPSTGARMYASSLDI